MATEKPLFTDSFIAAADYSTTGQYRFVTMSAANTVALCTGATDIPVGVLQNNPVAGAAGVVCMAGITKVEADAAIAVGLLIGTSADGQADRKVPGTDTTEYTVGMLLEASGGAGEIVTAAINCLSPCRAA